MLLHNYPAGYPTSCPDDFMLTTRMVNASDSTGIDMVDHLILLG